MTIGLVFITHNRLAYTKLALTALLADSDEEFSLTIWDNASTDGTAEYLSSVEDPRIVKKVMSRENAGLKGPVNHLFTTSSADLVGIIPDDFLVTPGWTRTLAQAHADVPELGMIACWHLAPDEFDYERAKHKIQRFGDHQVLRHPFTGGGGGLVKLESIRKFGLLESNGTPSYWMRMARAGYVNGYYVPLIYVEHMDYPWSKYFAYSDKFEEWLEVSRGAKLRGMRTLEDAKAWHKVVVGNILDDPWDVKYYVGWRAKVKRVRGRIRRLLKR